MNPNIKTHFLFTDAQGKPWQVALGFLPYVPRVGEDITFIAQDRKSQLYGRVAVFHVERIAYECYGMTLPMSQTWETVDGMQGAFQVILYVTPEESEQTYAYIQRVIEAAKDDC